MRDRSCFIINPASSFGQTKKKLHKLVEEIKYYDQEAKVLITRHALHATGLTSMAIKDGYERIGVIGGDGTINEVINGYFEDGKAINKEASIGIVKSGTGSDFARSLKLANTTKEQIHNVMCGSKKKIDVGLVSAHDNNHRAISRYFINISSVGLSGLVAGNMKTTTKSFGASAAYFLATIKAIKNLQPQKLHIEKDGQEIVIDDCSLLSFANGKYFGGGMKVAPDAQIDDGVFSMIGIERLKLSFFLSHGFKVYNGTHTTLDNVHAYNMKKAKVSNSGHEPMYVETDGELFAQLPATYEVVPRSVNLVE